MDRRCEVCRKKYESASPRSRFCSSTCRSRAHRGGQSRKPEPAAATLVAIPASQAPAGDAAASLVERTEQALRDANRLDTWQGQAALDLARRIDRAHTDTGSAYAGLHRELRAAMELAVKGATSAKSVLEKRRDELAARRDRTRRA